MTHEERVKAARRARRYPVCEHCGQAIHLVSEPGLYGWFTVKGNDGDCPCDAMNACHYPVRVR